jgi:oxygen-independent coproporphyrinogen-3 oxidase
MSEGISLYLHIPFCTHRCSYCDFNTYAGQEKWIPDYIAALRTEIAQVSAACPHPLPPVHTIFFGGGTPSLIPAKLLAEVMQTIHTHFDVHTDAEVTLEANPGTVSAESLTQLRAAGFNRLSMGMQSVNPEELTMLERQHDSFDVIQAVKWARQAGFDNINLDLIFGIPGQSLETWQHSLDFAAGLRPEHLSLYSLTVEHGTPFLHWVERGLVQLPDDDTAADMYDLACAFLEQKGYAHYEISNWGLRQGESARLCQHNLQYWRNLDYFGFGTGASGYVDGVRTMNVRGIRAYTAQMNAHRPNFPAGPACEQRLPVDRWMAMQEHMMVGLRLLQEGVNRDAFYSRFGVSLEQAFPEQINRFIKQGLLEWAGQNKNSLRLTQHAWLLGNAVFRDFVGLPQPDFLFTQQ